MVGVLFSMYLGCSSNISTGRCQLCLQLLHSLLQLCDVRYFCCLGHGQRFCCSWLFGLLMSTHRRCRNTYVRQSFDSIELNVSSPTHQLDVCVQRFQPPIRISACGRCQEHNLCCRHLHADAVRLASIRHLLHLGARPQLLASLFMPCAHTHHTCQHSTMSHTSAPLFLTCFFPPSSAK